jgi:hypothetical protein
MKFNTTMRRSKAMRKLLVVLLVLALVLVSATPTQAGKTCNLERVAKRTAKLMVRHGVDVPFEDVMPHCYPMAYKINKAIKIYLRGAE